MSNFFSFVIVLSTLLFHLVGMGWVCEVYHAFSLL